MIFSVCIDSGFCLSEVGLFWVESVVLRVLSWGKIGCLGCFVDSTLQIGNSSNGWVRVCLLGFSVVVHPQDGMERGLYPGVCHVMWCARFSVSSFAQGVVSVCNVSSLEISIPRQYYLFCLR